MKEPLQVRLDLQLLVAKQEIGKLMEDNICLKAAVMQLQEENQALRDTITAQQSEQTE